MYMYMQSMYMQSRGRNVYLEDELNFVCVCPKYDSLREHLVSIVCNDNPNFVFLSVNDKFLNLMQALDSHVLTALSKFVFMSFKLDM